MTVPVVGTTWELAVTPTEVGAEKAQAETTSDTEHSRMCLIANLIISSIWDSNEQSIRYDKRREVFDLWTVAAMIRESRRLDAVGITGHCAAA